MTKLDSIRRKKYRHKYEAVFCDVDGTLVTNKFEGKMSRKVSQTLIRAKKKVTIGIVSGRPLDRVTFLFKELGLKKPCIINGGAQIVHPVSRKILWEKPILPEDLKIITNIINRLSSKIWVVDNNREKKYSQNLIIKKPISFFIPKIEEEKADAIIRSLSQTASLSLNKVVAYHRGYVALHITNSGGTKKFATLKLAEMLKIKSANIIGIGDGYNDFPLFKACGLRVAVGNAVPQLQSMADYIAPSVQDDGVADVIDKFILLRR